jgi:DNA polymerase-3 subunit epsilon
MLELQKPLAFLDIETTGLDVTNDRIIEIAILKMNPDGSQERYHKRINPQIPISKESSEITGIRDEDVMDCPTFEEVAQEIADFIADSDLVGYNSSKFDIPVLAESFLRAGSDFDMSARRFIDVQNIFHKMEQRTLAAAYQFYCNQELKNAHSAMADIEATYEVFVAQLNRYDDLKKDIDFLAAFSKAGTYEILDFAGRLARNEKGEAVYNFGKHKGKTIEEVDKEEPGYYGWMLNANFPLYTKKVLKEEMAKVKAKRHSQKANEIENKIEALKNKFMNK